MKLVTEYQKWQIRCKKCGVYNEREASKRIFALRNFERLDKWMRINGAWHCEECAQQSVHLTALRRVWRVGFRNWFIYLGERSVEIGGK